MGMEKQKSSNQKRKRDGIHNGAPLKKDKTLIRNFLDWSVSDVSGWLESKKFGTEVVAHFVGENINGERLNQITIEFMEDCDLHLEDVECRRLLEELDILRDNTGTSVNTTYVRRNTPSSLHRTPTKYLPAGEETKVFNDPIHGHIELHPLCVRIVDTPQFQRLRCLKQLGGCYFVYPGASHNRFEHCIGVSHLAGQLVRTLQHKQPELNINNKDILCVEIAGLCHDLGHGPFSHMFDGKFIPRMQKGTEWKHEDASVEMFEYLVKKNNLKKEFHKFGLFDRDIKFIAEQINGPLQRTGNSNAWAYQGRPEKKSFLYEIVANKRNGIDVDKWDYFARDSHHLGIRSNFDHMRFMKFVRVISVDGQTQICSRDKEVEMIYEMFHTRLMLHRRAYQHKIKSSVESMISEAFIAADKHLTFYGENGKPMCLSDTIFDMEAYTQVNDHVYYQILYSRSKELEPARAILQRIERRDLYKCVGHTKPDKGTRLNRSDEERFREEVVLSLTEEELGAPQLSKDDFLLKVVDLDYGMKDKNPLEHVRFYSKDNPDRATCIRKEQVSEMLPDKFSDQVIRAFCKKTDSQSISTATRCFEKWCQNQGYFKPRGGGDIDLTPYKAEPSTSADNNEPAKKKLCYTKP